MTVETVKSETVTMHLGTSFLDRVQARKDRTLKTEYWDQKFYVKIETSEGNVIYKVKTLQTKNKSFWEQSFVDTQDKDPTEYATLCMRRLSKKERRVDALALRADERRDKLR